MKDLDSFVDYFTDKKIPSMKKRTKYYSPSNQEYADAPLVYTTELLGKQKRNSFIPSFPLLEKIGKTSKRKAVLNDKAAWLFICGNNVLKEGMESCEYDEGFVLVTNQRDEVLGYGKRTGVGITNTLDRGDFLRRAK